MLHHKLSSSKYASVTLQHIFRKNITFYGERGSVVVKALYYKSEGLGFEIRCGEWFFSIYLIIPAALWLRGFTQPVTEMNTRNLPGEYSAVGVRLTNLLPSVSRLSRQSGILNISQPFRTPRPVTGIALLYGDGVCFRWGTIWTVSTATSSQYRAVNCEPIV
jgi:hypothetical protein